MLKRLAPVLIFLGLAIFSTAQEKAKESKESAFQVDLISPSKEYLFVDNTWKTNADCIQAKVSVNAVVSASGTVLKAYLFDASGKLVHTVEEPSNQADGNGGTIAPPTQFEKGKRYQVFFAIPAAYSSGATKWKRALVVFGRSGDVSAKIYPKDDLTKFDFPEKASVKNLEK